MDNTRNTVLACIDGSTLTEAVVDYAAWISRKVGNPLKLLHNLDRLPAPARDLSGNLTLGAREHLLEELTQAEERANKLRMEQGRLLLDQARERAIRREAFEPGQLQRHGSLAETLIELEEEIRVLVLGVRGEDHENKENQLGAQLETVIRSMHRPVLVVNHPFERAPQNLMLAYDGSEQAGKALAMVASSPLYRDMHCHLIQVSKNADDEQGSLAEAQRRLEEAGLTVTRASLQGDPGESLLTYQRDKGIDLTVMGAFGQNRLRELLFGSVTIKMLCRSRVPLLLLR